MASKAVCNEVLENRVWTSTSAAALEMGGAHLLCTPLDNELYPEMDLDLFLQASTSDPDTESYLWKAPMNSNCRDPVKAGKTIERLKQPIVNGYGISPLIERPKEYPEWNQRMGLVDAQFEKQPWKAIPDTVLTEDIWSAPFPGTFSPSTKSGLPSHATGEQRLPKGEFIPPASGQVSGKSNGLQAHCCFILNGAVMPDVFQSVGHFPQSGMMSPPSQDAKMDQNGTAVSISPPQPSFQGHNPPGSYHTEPTNWFSTPSIGNLPAEIAPGEMHLLYPAPPTCASGLPSFSFSPGTPTDPDITGRDDEYVSTHEFAEEPVTGTVEPFSSQGPFASGHSPYYSLPDFQLDGSTMRVLFADVSDFLFETQETYDAPGNEETTPLNASLGEHQPTFTDNVQGNIVLPGNVSLHHQTQQSLNFTAGYRQLTSPGAENHAECPATAQSAPYSLAKAVVESATFEMDAFDTATPFSIPSSSTRPLTPVIPNHQCQHAACSHQFPDKRKLADHIRSKHNSYLCRYRDCDREFSHGKTRWNHEAAHKGTPHRCLHCGYSSSRKGNVKRHMKKHGI